MKLGIIGYVPPDHGYPLSFLRNMAQFKTRNPLYLYSDAPETFGLDIKIPKPAENVGYRNLPLSISNAVFLRGMEIAIANELDYFLYIEEDSRVRTDYWDERLFNEFLEVDGAVIGGTPSVANMGVCGAEGAKRAIAFCSKVIRKTSRPPLIWSGRGSFGGPIGLFVYSNGSGSIYHTATVKAIFNGYQSDFGSYCANLCAWDWFIGRAMWNRFALESFDRIAVLRSEYSGYHDCAYTLVERKKMLTDGDVVLIHQCKTDWVPE